MVLSNVICRELLDNVAPEKNRLSFASVLVKNISHIENVLKRIMLAKHKSIQS